MVNKTGAYEHLTAFLWKLNINPNIVRKISIDRDHITVVMFVRDWKGEGVPVPERRIGSDGSPALTAIEIPLNDWEAEV